MLRVQSSVVCWWVNPSLGLPSALSWVQRLALWSGRLWVRRLAAWWVGSSVAWVECCHSLPLSRAREWASESVPLEMQKEKERAGRKVDWLDVQSVDWMVSWSEMLSWELEWVFV